MKNITNIRLQKNYTQIYYGEEENRSIVQRTEEGLFLDTWDKFWEVQKSTMDFMKQTM